ncbi:MAG TPA: argininosuccinate lyase [Thermodesulfovibrionales bacterium]|nr:argininosuccinate lyase [Thermodesulfovibrionales bacterium]
MKKPWAGRFTQKTSDVVESFTESISFDKKLWKHDIAGSIAHAKMLAKQRIITKKESAAIIAGLCRTADAIAGGKFTFSAELEDIHMNIEAALTARIGDPGKKLHTARSRNDQVALDLRLYLREQAGDIISLLRKLQKTFLAVAEKHQDTVMPGYTHLQRAQPVLLAHHLLAYVEMFGRDAERFHDCMQRMDSCPLGACALAGTSLPTDRVYTAKLLGFSRVSGNSIDAVSDRDFALEFLSCAAIAMMHLSRIAEELILWSTEEFKFIEISDRFTTGSSIMPQKKNPDVAELLRGKTGRVYGNLMALLTLMKGLPLAYNRDMQEDKLPVFDSAETLRTALAVLQEMMQEVSFNRERMSETAAGGYSTATDIAEYLVRKGVPFRVAHEITGRIVLACISKNIPLSGLSLQELRSFSPAIADDIRALLDPAASVRARASFGGTPPSEVKRQIRHFRKLLK